MKAERDPPAVTVICVNFNCGARLLACVRSVLGSTLPVCVVVADNGSSDGSLAALRAALGADARLTIIENGANLGFARANNIALEFAAGDYLLFLNPDTVVEPATLAAVREAMEANPRAGMAGCVILNPDGSEQRGCRRRTPTPGVAMMRAFGWSGRGGVPPLDMAGEPLPERPVEVEAISGAFMFVRRRAMEAVGPLDEGYFLHCEDLDWCLRFRQAGYPVLFVPGARAIHFQGTASAGRPVRVEWHKHRGMLRYYRKFFLRDDPWWRGVAVFAGVWMRFIGVALRLLVRRLLRT